MRHLLIACTLAGLALNGRPAAAAASPPRPASRLTIEAALAPDAFGRRPMQQAWSPDGRRLIYLWEGKEGKALWLLDAATGRSEVLARLADLGEDDKALDLDALLVPPEDSLSSSPRGTSTCSPSTPRNPGRASSGG